MTDLAELLETFSDKVFSVKFHKQPTEEHAQESLLSTKFKDLKDKAKLSSLVKGLIEGENCEMTCHLVKAENSLGRSTVIDLDAKTPSKFRQVDHRTIEYLIFRNVKYVLKKGGKKEPKADGDDEEKKGEKLWDHKNLAVGNWFSGTSYYEIKSAKGDQVTTSCYGKEVLISREILEHEMFNANVFASEEKMPLTKVGKILNEAHSTAFTVCFTTKVDEKAIQERLAKCTEAEFKNAKALAKEVLVGRETIITGRLT